MQFFSARQDLNIPRFGGREIAFFDYKNIDGFIATIITSVKATLRELKEVYTLEDAFDLFEIVAINNYNEHLAIEHSKNHKER